MAAVDDLRMIAEQTNDELLYAEEPVEEMWGRAALHEAVRRGDANTVEALVALRLGLDEADAEGWAPLHLAASLGHERVVGLLLANGARADVRSACLRAFDGCTPLHTAVAGGHARVVELLLKAGADPDLRDDCGYTALHLASELGRADLVRKLILAGARLDPLVGDDTALGLAQRERRMEVVGLLEQLGAPT